MHDYARRGIAHLQHAHVDDDLLAVRAMFYRFAAARYRKMRLTISAHACTRSRLHACCAHCGNLRTDARRSSVAQDK